MCRNTWRSRARVLAACAASALLMVLSRSAQAQSCKQVIADQAAAFEHTQLTTLQACEDQKRSGALPAITDCLNAKTTQSALKKALKTAQSAVKKACNGASLSSIGWGSDGSSGNPVLAKACSAGDRPGEPCVRETECPGQCVGGAKNEESCTFNSSCADHACVAGTCIGGSKDGVDCSNDKARKACVKGKGFCPWLEGQAPPGAGNVGSCNGGSNNQGGCSANSDCPGGTCDGGCNTGNLLDSVSGICEQALCSSNKDCGLCTAPGAPFLNQSCASDTDCGKVCTGGTAAGAPCKVAATDCPGGGTCGAISGACKTGTCSSGFCTAGSGAHARASSGLCQPAARCPAFKNNSLPGAVCSGGKKNGLACKVDKDCGKVKGVQIKCVPGCDFPLLTAIDAGNCGTCLAGAAATDLNSFFFGTLTAKSSNSSLETCKTAVADAGATFADAKRTALKTCEDTALAGSGSCPDATATTAINAARTTLQNSIASACSGLTAEQIATVFTCPAFTVPGTSTSCAGPTNRGDISSVTDLANCIACVADFSTSCTDRLTAPAGGAPYPECNPSCGNGKIDGHCSNNSANTCGSSLDCPGGTCIPSETCDDSNANFADACPSTCNVATCKPGGSAASISVKVNSPTALGALSVFVEYPDGVVAIPGSGVSTDSSRFTADPSLIVTANDLDYAVRVGLLAGSGSVPLSPAFQVNMDTCAGAGAPTAAQFICHVESASDTGQNVVTGVTCAVSVP